MDIYPTYLYIKQHEKTGLLYFGKTTQNPETYMGSGTYWKKHIKKHGKHIITLWYCLFLDADSIKEFATTFSISHNIVESTSWANLKIEDGLEGGDTSMCIDYSQFSQKFSGENNPMFGSKGGMFGKNQSNYQKHQASERLKKLWSEGSYIKNKCYGEKNPMFGKSPANAIKIKYNNMSFDSKAALFRYAKEAGFRVKHKHIIYE